MVGAGTRITPLVVQSEDDKNEKAVIGCKSDGRDDASPKTIIKDPCHGPCHEATGGTDENDLKFLKPMSPPKPNQKRRRKSSLKQTSSFINLDSSIDSDSSPKKGRRLSFSDENGLNLAEVSQGTMLNIFDFTSICGKLLTNYAQQLLLCTFSAFA